MYVPSPIPFTSTNSFTSIGFTVDKSPYTVPYPPFAITTSTLLIPQVLESSRAASLASVSEIASIFTTMSFVVSARDTSCSERVFGLLISRTPATTVFDGCASRASARALPRPAVSHELDRGTEVTSLVIVKYLCQLRLSDKSSCSNIPGLCCDTV
jgi:hypothetical protein